MVKLSAYLLQAFKPSSPQGLYKYLIRSCNKLPHDASKYYKESVRKEYEQHCEEDDPERIQQIMERAVKDAEWILNKYKK